MISNQEKTEFIKVEKKNNNMPFSIILLFIFIAGFSVGYFLPIDKTSENQNLVTPGSIESGNLNEFINPADIVNKPPSLSLKGELTLNKELVEVTRRGEDFWVDAASVSAILQDESLRTDDTGLAVLTFANKATLRIDSLSQLYLPSLIPDSFLVVQESGTVNYIVKEPISVRYSDSLASLKIGEFDFSINPDTRLLYIDIASGSGKFAFIDDTTNETEVYNIEEGDRVTYNPENTTIVIR